MTDHDLTALAAQVAHMAWVDAVLFVEAFGEAFESAPSDWTVLAFASAMKNHGLISQALPAEMYPRLFQAYSQTLETETRRLLKE